MDSNAQNRAGGAHNDTTTSVAPVLAEKVPCGECKGSGGTSVFAAINHGAHACTDCNGKGFNWEPVEPSVEACSPAPAPSCELCNAEYGGLCKMQFDWCKEVHAAPAPAAPQ